MEAGMIAFIVVLIVVFVAAIVLSVLMGKKSVTRNKDNKQLVVIIRSSEEGFDGELKAYTSNGWKAVSTSRSKKALFKKYKWTVVLERDEEFLQSLPSAEE
ncbi:MAG: hypothetical protein LUI60_06630 [Clostridia bacterium]|nr:hypothetical protein [Clostridia bacterium]